jgi:hypothetical protein
LAATTVADAARRAAADGRQIRPDLRTITDHRPHVRTS